VLSTNAYVAYINRGGLEPVAFQVSLASCVKVNNLDTARALLRVARERNVFKDLSVFLLNDIATLFINSGDYNGAVDVYIEALEYYPEYLTAIRNIEAIARLYSIPAAVNFYRRGLDSLVSNLPVAEAPAGFASICDFDARGDTLEEISRAITFNGFCAVRNLCDPRILEAVTRLLSAKETSALSFPLSVNDVPELAEFQIVERKWVDLFAEILGSGVRFDPRSSVIRRVDPSSAATATPFHQDTNAFGKLLINVWVPLTPAGGEYPTLQLVRRRITWIEQAKLCEGAYN